MEIRNRIALVTGGAHRVGKAIALALAQAGAHTIITYLSAADEAAQTLREIEALGVQALALPLDQRDTTQIETLLETIGDRFGRLDILVNSAAIMERRLLFDVTPDDWDRTLDTNLRGPFFIAQAAARLMLGQRPERSAAGSDDAATHGCIINIADASALHPWPSYIAHTVSKAGLVALTKALALALAPAIRVNAVAPGAVLKPQAWSDAHWRQLAERIPLGRSGAPEDVAEAVLYLIRSDFVTGQLLVLDGGRELR
ncbi:MAG TPA: SDR family oxidoreductase [Anaerolineae bacterium]|nr:SDR family oxidoreductase [Anaerolineae bacterium]